MQSLWNESEAALFGQDPLALRVYTSRLLGRDPSLVLHGGGNTSVKAIQPDLFGEAEEILFIKGSGGDLATIDRSGFAPVRLAVLRRMAELAALTDSAMVRAQRSAMTDPYAPNPSVEAILHAIIPFRYVDHTHADAVVAVSNTPGGEARIGRLYGPRVLVVPYVMPGFVLARAIREMTRNIDWSRYEGMVLLHHGLFSFSDDARESYERMIHLVTAAEEYLASEGALGAAGSGVGAREPEPAELARLRQAVSRVRQAPVIARLDSGPEAVSYSRLPRLKAIAGQGPLTPDHVIRTKRVPAILDGEIADGVERFAADYRAYFDRNNRGGLSCLDPAPRWAVWPGRGTAAFGRSVSEARIIADIIRHTVRAQQWSEALGGWKALPEKDLFEMEYWELEQAKLAKAGGALPFQGRVALVTGAASGIGKATALALLAQGAAVAALDIHPAVQELDPGEGLLALECDVTNAAQVRDAVGRTVRAFGGLDILVSNAGVFPPSLTIAAMEPAVWQRSLDLNLTSHQVLLQAAIPCLERGWEPAVVLVGSKNVSAPGPGASAYSVAKAGLSQLARVAALELAGKGIRVNTVHPNAVFDTGIWTDEVLEQRAQHYGLTVAEYKTGNLLRREVTSRDVADLICALAGPLFAKTTGAQIPIDGGNERVI